MSNTPVTFLDRLKALFAKDRNDFWFRHFSSDEIALKRMDVWELAKVINEARVRNLAGDAEKLTVAQYMLQERLAKIQALPAYVSLVVAFIGVIVGAYLTAAFQPAQPQSKCVCEYQSASAAKNSEPSAVNTLIPTTPSNSAVGVPGNIKPGAAIQNNSQPAEKKKP